MATTGQLVSGSLTAAGRGASFHPISNRPFDVWIYGTFVGTVVLIRSLDNGTTWVPVASPTLSGVASFTAPITLSAFEADGAIIWAISCSPTDGGAFTSGTINYQFNT